MYADESKVISQIKMKRGGKILGYERNSQRSQPNLKFNNLNWMLSSLILDGTQTKNEYVYIVYVYTYNVG